MNLNGFFAAGFWKTLQRGLLAREFRENLIELGNLQISSTFGDKPTTFIWPPSFTTET